MQEQSLLTEGALVWDALSVANICLIAQVVCNKHVTPDWRLPAYLYLNPNPHPTAAAALTAQAQAASQLLERGPGPVRVGHQRVSAVKQRPRHAIIPLER
jgi:hypothetical protein